MLSLQKASMLPHALTLARKKLSQYAQRLLPLSCLLCQQGITTGLVCHTCYQDLKQTYPHCLRCGLPLTSTESMCGQCIRKPPKFSSLHACGLFQPPLNQLIYHLKYQKQSIYSYILGQLMAEKISAYTASSANITLPQALLPIPLHPRKERQRGFNQAQLIAEHCAKTLNLPCQSNWVKRVKNTTSQTQLNVKQRKRNMQQAFKVTALPAQLNHVAIIDDIVTTGATVDSLCKELQKAGVSQIEIWCICRTPTTRP
ncbi:MULTISPECIES: ComF family protein [unclassified Motilimonas]|uniref:ComF family protein n=1 Tax=unclassified Motilimonas TaxID=2643697 RepID=UPI001E3CEABF|nr:MULTISPECIES: ComF family protein [unclassified Motilimonas]MCE0557355.1 ComF family protein [Motilimonas sp. E26]MDO6527343.1 ComF family protein [Motilimonas sp. 1_MG-2023]